MRCEAHALLRRQLGERRTLDDLVALGGDDAALLGDGCRRGDVVARDHPHDDAGVLAHADRRRDFRTDRVLDSDHPDKDEVLLVLFGGLGAARVRALGDADGAEGLVGELFDVLLDRLAVGVGEVDDLAVLRELFGAEPKDDLGRALRQERLLAVDADERAHPLALRRERDQPVERVLLAGLDVVKPEGAAEPNDGAVRPVPDHHGLAGLVLALVRRAVDADVGQQQVHQFLGEELLDARDFGDNLAAEVRLDHGHFVLCQRSRLVGADCRRAAHGLARVQVADEVVVPEHLAHRVRECDSDRERKTLRHGDDDDGDRRDDVLGQHVCEREVERLMSAEEVEQELEHKAAKDECGGEDSELGDRVGETAQLLLKRGLLGLRLERHHDCSRLRVGTDGNDEHLPDALEDEAARVQDGMVLVLLDRVGLAGHRTLVALHVKSGEEQPVRTQDVAHFDLHDVADDDVVHTHLLVLAVADRLDLLVVLLAVQLAELLLLRVVVQRRHHHDDDDGEEDRGALDPARVWVLEKPENKRDSRGNHEHDERLVLQALNDELEQCLCRGFGNTI